MVADQDRGVDAPPGVGRGPASPERRLVDHVVVDQSRGVQELDDAAEPHRTVPRVGPERGTEEHEDGPETLATGERDMPGKIADERNGRPLQLLVNRRLAGAHLGAHETVEALSEDPFQGQRHRESVDR